MNDFRCSQCKKLLGKIEGKAEIQCPRCKTINRGMTISYTWQEACKDGPPYGMRIPVSKDGIIKY